MESQETGNESENIIVARRLTRITEDNAKPARLEILRYQPSKIGGQFLTAHIIDIRLMRPVRESSGSL